MLERPKVKVRDASPISTAGRRHYEKLAAKNVASIKRMPLRRNMSWEFHVENFADGDNFSDYQTTDFGALQYMNPEPDLLTRWM